MSGPQRLMAGLMANMAMRGGAMGSIGRIGGAVMLQRQGANLGAGTLGFLIPDFLKLGASLVGLPKKLHDFAEATLEAQRGMSRYHGGMAAIFAKLHVGDIRRAQASGDARFDSTNRLAGATERMRDEWRPIGDLTANAMNYVGAGGAEVVAFLGKIAASTAELVGIELKKEGKEKRNNFAGIINDMAKLAKAERFGPGKGKGANPRVGIMAGRLRPPIGKKPAPPKPFDFDAEGNLDLFGG